MNGRTSISFKMTCRTCFTDTTGDTLYAIESISSPLPSRLSSLLPSSCFSFHASLAHHPPPFLCLPLLAPSFPPPPSKLDVYTVAERDLFMGDLAHNPQFRASIPPPSKETLVLVAGPEYFTAKVVDYLTKSGYAEDVIVAL